MSDLESLRSGARAAPSDPVARTGYAAALLDAGLAAQAREELADALRLCGDSAALWWRLAVAEAALGRGADARSSARRALQAGPSSPEDWYRIGTLLLELQQPEEAEPVLREAARLDSPNATVLSRLADAEHAAANDAAALEHRAQARALRPGDLATTVAQALYLPLIPPNSGAVEERRVLFARGLQALHGDEARWREDPAQVFRLGHENFLLAYHGEDDLPLQRSYSTLLAKLATAARPEWREPRRLRWDGRRRLRIGFAASTFYECTAGRYFERWITGLDAARFERVTYHLSPYSDALTARIAAACDGFIAMPALAEPLARRIAADALDILVYPEVGMTPALYVLCGLRLAPLQLVGWGHPVTTGSDAIDGYFTADAMEPADGAAHYVERLLPLPGIGVQYAMPAAVTPMPRAELRVAEDAALYACPQSLFKIHPAMDADFAALLARDPNAALLFFQGATRGVTARFAERLQATFTRLGLAPRGQVKFLPRMGGEGFRRVLAACDVVIDTRGWSGGNTSLDALSAGTPVVTSQGRFMRGRQTAAMLRTMGLESLVAATEAAWVESAHAIAHDAAARAALREAIVARRGELFDRPEPLAAFEQTLLRLAQEAAT